MDLIDERTNLYLVDAQNLQVLAALECLSGQRADRKGSIDSVASHRLTANISTDSLIQDVTPATASANDVSNNQINAVKSEVV